MGIMGGVFGVYSVIPDTDQESEMIKFAEFDHKIEKMRSVLDICVCNPVTDKFTTFEILIKTSNPAFTLNHSRTRRRYNDFVWLKKLLKKHNPLSKPPELPDKKSSSERFEPQFLVQRMKELEDWLYMVVEEDLLFSDSSFHLFLQTDLTGKQIEAYMSGELSEAVVQAAYKNCDCNHGQSPFLPDGDQTMPGPSSQASAAISLREEDHRAQNSPRESQDSGLSQNEYDSDMDSSSYEYSVSSSEVPGQTGYPPITEVDRALRKTSLSPGNVISTRDVTHDVSKTEGSLENVIPKVDGDSCDRERSTEDKKPASGPRVQMGVIFSINS